MEKVIEYIKPYAPYAVGDVTKVSKDEAEALVEAGVVKYYDEAQKTKMVDKPAKAKKAGK